MCHPSVIPRHRGGLTVAYDILTTCRLRASFLLASFAFWSFLFLSFALCPRVWNRTVDHDDDGEGEHDRRGHPREQDQQGRYLG